MPRYKYRFCDGTVCEVEVSEADFALLKGLDEQEYQNNMRQRRGNASLARYVWKEEKPDRERDNEFAEDNT